MVLIFDARLIEMDLHLLLLIPDPFDSNIDPITGSDDNNKQNLLTSTDAKLVLVTFMRNPILIPMQ